MADTYGARREHVLCLTLTTGPRTDLSLPMQPREASATLGLVRRLFLDAAAQAAGWSVTHVRHGFVARRGDLSATFEVIPARAATDQAGTPPQATGPTTPEIIADLIGGARRQPVARRTRTRNPS
jgi:hypothetical protein